MTITHETTTAELHALYVENQNYDLDADTAACRMFIRAARALHAQIVKSKAKRVQIDGVPVELDAALIERQIGDAIAYLNGNDPAFRKRSGRSGGTFIYDMSGIRE
ncbi:hypothetical protein [Roseiconus lacunae]|uniref:Phage gp6-like head-tail connector protein n=1 Tax=Roseiconus lacunae TaxID=2605694 RepID=A0ABT7PEP9_9BACT|nr:hypothetical protein [Roseiconus lacunae]MDM4014964.1 hypothetical protein [Roseiconus lacunae]